MTTLTITLPFPPASLSGHTKGHWRSNSGTVAKHREWARRATPRVPVGQDGDIQASVDFYPPNRRGDRLNYPNRLKAYWDGISDRLSINDKRFDVPTYRTHPVEKPGRVVITIQLPEASE